MNVQLLLLLALAGPFCAFTHASPTGIPTELHSMATSEFQSMEPEGTAVEEPVIAGPPATVPNVAPVEDTTALPEEVASATAVITEKYVSETEAVTAAAEGAEPLPSDAPVQETTAIPEETTETEDQTTATEAQPEVTAAPEVQTVVTAAAEVLPEVTEAAEVLPEVTEAAEVLPEVTEAAEVQPELTVATSAEMGQGEVVLENGSDGELSSGQVVGIVIGALLAVVIVIAVVITVVRRMGKYSSVRNKKPVKRDNIMISPLKKKSTKQHENPKFWKF